MHTGIDQVVVSLINLGQTAVEIVAQQLRHPRGQTVVFAVAHRPAVGIAQPGQQIDLIEGLQRQRRHYIQRHGSQAAIKQHRFRFAPLFETQLVEAGILRRIQPQTLRRHKPAAAVGAVNHAAGLQLRQALTHRNPRRVEQRAQLALGRQLVAAFEGAVLNTRLQLRLNHQVLRHLARG